MLKSIISKHTTRYLPENNRIELIWKIAQLDFRKRYYHDNLGIFWSLLEPAFRIGVYYFVFKVVMKFEQMDNYALFIYSGILFWGIFSVEASKIKMLLKQKRYLIENIQFNKFDLLIAQVLSNSFTFVITFIVYLLVALIVDLPLNWNLLFVPILLLNTYLITLGIGMMLAIAYIFIRDVNHFWDILKLFLFWTSGVFLRGEKFLEMFPFLIFLNPLIPILVNVRRAIFNGENIDLNLMIIALVYGLLIFLIGLFLFNKYSHLAIEKL